MEHNFWELGNSVNVNFGEHLNLVLRKKGTTVNFHREQGNMHPVPPPLPREALYIRQDASELLNFINTDHHFQVKAQDKVLILTHNV